MLRTLWNRLSFCMEFKLLLSTFHCIFMALFRCSPCPFIIFHLHNHFFTRLSVYSFSSVAVANCQTWISFEALRFWRPFYLIKKAIFGRQPGWAVKKGSCGGVNGQEIPWKFNLLFFKDNWRMYALYLFGNNSSFDISLIYFAFFSYWITVIYSIQILKYLN